MFKKNNIISLKSKILGLSLLIIVLLGISSFFIVRNFSSALENQAITSMKNFSHNLQYGIAAQFFERYGDVQAFAENTVIKKMDKEKMSEALDSYTKLYLIYDLIIVADLEGNFVAANSVDPQGNKLNLEKLSKMNFKEEPWFRAVVENRFTEDKEKGFFGTFVEDPHFDHLSKAVYGKEMYGSAFSSAIKDASGKVVGVITNRAGSRWFEGEFKNIYELMKDLGYGKAELQFVDKEGKLLLEYDPSLAKNKSFFYDPNKIGVLNLAKDFKSVDLTTKGEEGIIEEFNPKKNHLEEVAYHAIVEDKFTSKALGWSILVREDMDESLAVVFEQKRLFYISFVVIIVFVLMLAYFNSSQISNRFIDKAKLLEESSKKIAKEVEQLSTASKQLAATTVSQASSVEETVSSATEISEMVNRSSELAQNSKSESARMINLSSDGKVSVEKVAYAMDEISKGNETIFEQINKGNDELERIIKLISEITEKTKMIDDIVFQTKLLSFNASVEAARAGDHGKGFAVVAEEVGKLAILSGTQSREISELLNSRTKEIEGIVIKTKQATSEITKDVKQKLTEGNLVTKECLELFSQIAKQAESVSTVSEEIATSSKEQALGVSQISEAMNSISSSTHEVSQVADSTAQSSVAIDSQVESLEKDLDEMLKLIKGA